MEVIQIMIRPHRGRSRPSTPEDTRFCKRYLFWVFFIIGSLMFLTRCSGAEPQIKLSVDGDTVVLVVRSTVRFTVWSSVNPSAIWWPVYTSPAPAPGVEIVWVAINSKAGVFPDWCFWRVTAERGLR